MLNIEGKTMNLFEYNSPIKVLPTPPDNYNSNYYLEDYKKYEEELSMWYEEQMKRTRDTIEALEKQRYGERYCVKSEMI